MAKNQATRVKTNSKMRTKWVQNAMKSIGLSTQEALKDIYPNLSEVTFTGAQTTKNILTTLKTSASGTERVTKDIKKNKYVQFASKAYQNALSDLKSGNFNNTDRFMSSGTDDEFGDLFDFADDGGSDISFNDEDTGNTTNNVNLNYVDKGNSDAILAFSAATQKQSEAILKTNKASMDAYIAVSSASMYQMEKLGGEIVNHLSNINNNLSALVQYNNENMTRYIEASMAYYESVGANKESDNYGSGKTRINAMDVFNNNKGGLNLGQYKKFVKQQITSAFKESPVGMLEMLNDDNILEMAASNPLGFASKGIISYMIPKLVGTTISSVEKTFSSFVPTMLNRLADWGDEYATGILGNMKKYAGKVFGVRIDKKNTIEAAKINKGPIPFDGETKHAITEIITKELREQTSYLKAIAERNKVDTNKARLNADVWDYTKNKYVKVQDVQKEILENIQDSYLNAFKSGEFGKQIQSLIYGSTTDDKTQESLMRTLDQILTEAGNAKSHIYIGDKGKDSEWSKIRQTIIKRNKGERTNLNEIENMLMDMASKDPAAFADFTRSLLDAKAKRNSAIKDIEEDPNYYNLFASGLNGANIDEEINKLYGYGKSKPGRLKDYKRASVVKQESNGGLLGSMMSSGINGMNKQMQKLMMGDVRGATGAFMEMVSDQTKILADKFSGNFLSPLKKTIFGSGEENEESVVSILSNMGTNIKNGVIEKLFGKKDKDGKRERSGIISSVLDKFKEGIDGWQEAFLGREVTEEDKEKLQKGVTETIKERMPASISGGLVGAGVGLATGGAGGSLLGMLVGGPIGGAAMGMVGGFLAKSEKFQNWLFGEKDEDGNRIGGVISKKIQDYFKENKNSLIGGATLGAGAQMIGLKSAGFLGNLVGGPIAGAITGVASSILLKSKTFNEFLFGSEESGQKGIIKAVTDAFNSHKKSTDNTSLKEGGKLVTMSAMGAGAGALTAGIISKMGLLGASLTPLGPVGGAIAGLGLSIAAQGKNFKTWLFGETEIDENGNKHRKQGVIGQFGNMLNANVFRPILHEGQYIMKDVGLTIKHDILTPFSFVAEGVADKLGGLYEGIRDKAADTLNEVGSVLKQDLISAAKSVFSPVTKLVTTSADLVYKTAKSMVLLPANVVKLGLNVVTSKAAEITKPIRELIKDVRRTIFRGLKNLMRYTMKGIGEVFKITTAPVRFIGGMLATGVSKVNNAVTNAMEKRNITPTNWGTKEGSFSERWYRATKNRKAEKAQLEKDRKTWKIHDKNARLIAKATKNQYSADTEEGREALKRADYKAYLKLNKSVLSEDEQKRVDAEKAKIEKEGKGTAGLNGKQLANTDVSKLNEEGKQTYFLQGIFNILRGKNWDGSKKEKGQKEKETNEEKKDRMREEKSKRDSKKKQEENQNPDNTDATFEEPEVGKAPGFKEFFLSTGLDLRDYFVGNKQQNKKGILSRTKDFLSQELENEKGYYRGLKTKYKDMGKYMLARHEERKDRKIRQQGGNGGFGDGEELTSKESQDTIPVYITNVSNQAADKMGSSDGGDAKTELLKAESKMNALSKAREAGINAEERKKQYDDEEKAKIQKDIRDATKKGAEISEKHSSLWASIFGKKGLITGGLILLAPLALKLVKWLVKGPGKTIGTGLVSLLSGVTSSLGDIISGSLSAFNFGQKNDAGTNGESIGTATKNEITNTKNAYTEITNGNILGGLNTFVTDENGEANNATGAKTKLLAHGVPGLVKRKVKRGLKKYNKVASKLGKKEITSADLIKEPVNFVKSNVKDTKNVLKVGRAEEQAGKALKKEFGSTVENVLTSNGGMYDNYVDAAEGLLGTTYKDHKATTKIGKAVEKGKTIINKAGGAASSLSDKAGSAFKKTSIGQKSDKILTKVLGYIDNFFSKIVEGVGKKLGKFSDSALGAILKGVKETITKSSSKIVKKVTPILTKGVALLASDPFWITLGALNGITGAAKLFQVDKEYVDGKMRIISAIIGGFNGSTVGSIVDVVNEVVAGITQVDFIHEIACAIYNFFSDSKKEEKLKKGQKEFENKYLDYKEDKIEESYNKALADGTIDPNMSLEEYTEGVKNGKYEVKYKSFIDYNSEQHQSLGGKITNKATNLVSKGRKKLSNIKKGISSGFKSVKKLGVTGVAKAGLKGIATLDKKFNEKTKSLGENINKVGKSIFNKGKSVGKSIKSGLNWLMQVSKDTRYVDDTDGSYYTQDGTHYSASGSKMEKIPLSELEKKIRTNEVISTKAENKESGITELYNKKIQSALKQKKKSLTNILDAWSAGDKTKTKAAKIVKKSATMALNYLKNGTLVGQTANLVSKIEKERKTKVYMDTEGNYYKLNGSKYDYCNINGDVIKSGVTNEEVEAKLKLGIITGTKEIKNPTAQVAVREIKSSIAKLWDNAKTTVSKGINSFTDWIKNSTQNNYVNFASSSTPQSGTTVTDSTTSTTTGGKGIVRGGRGGDSLNGFTYYSQSDSRWKDKSYNTGQDNATMNDSGCGPTAMSMVASEMTGKNVDPTEMASLAKATGNRDNTGTNWNFMNTAAGAYGINSQEVENPSAEYISDQLDQGKPMILSGTKGGGYGSTPKKSGSAYTSAGHYVVAVGKDNDGNVIVNDPRGKQYSGKYNLDDVASETGASWSFDGGYGQKSNPKHVFRSKQRQGGYGQKLNWMTCVKTVKAAIADKVSSYSQSNSHSYTINGKKIKIRDDCSGYVSGCLNLYGTFSNSFMTSSRGFISDVDSKMKSGGFTKLKFTSWNDLKEGDIIARPGHVEIFSHNKDGVHYVYSNGSTKGIKSKEPRKTGHSSYSIVWRPPENGSGSNTLSNGTSMEGVGSQFPTYTDLSDSEKKTIATVITGETGGDSLFESRQEASQMVNLNEHKGRSTNAKGLMKTVRRKSEGGWYADKSFRATPTKYAKQAVEDVIVKGHRTLPRYVVEHDWFPHDIQNPKDRSKYKVGDDVHNIWGSDYQFYTFFGENKKGDIAGYFKSDYNKYKNDIPWGENAAGSDLTGNSGGGETTTTETTESKSLVDAIGEYMSLVGTTGLNLVAGGQYDSSKFNQDTQNIFSGVTATGSSTTTSDTTGDENSQIGLTGNGNVAIKGYSKTGNSKWPSKFSSNGINYEIPNNKKFGSFARNHGCSLVSTSMGLQRVGIKKNPDEIYNYANKNIKSKNGAKLAIYGSMKTINKMAGQNVAQWYPITSSNLDTAAKNINNAVDSGKAVMMEEKDQGKYIHTTTFIGRKKNGNLSEVAYGHLRDGKTANWQVKNRAIKGSSDPSKQSVWWKGSNRSAGYVVVGPDGTPTTSNTSAKKTTNKSATKATTKKSTKTSTKKTGASGGGFGDGVQLGKNTFSDNIRNNTTERTSDGTITTNKTINNYINNKTNNINSDALQTIIALLQSIADSTLSTSQKMELLKKIGVGNNTTNNIITTNNSNNEAPIINSSSANSPSKNEELAHKIAVGV